MADVVDEVHALVRKVEHLAEEALVTMRRIANDADTLAQEVKEDVLSKAELRGYKSALGQDISRLTDDLTYIAASLRQGYWELRDVHPLSNAIGKEAT
jgi:phage shock protein A